MTIRKSRFLTALAVVLFSLGTQLASAKTFELGGKEGSATAITTKEELKLEVEIGKLEDYPDYPGTAKFVLIIGGCKLNLEGGKGSAGLNYYVEVNSKDVGSVGALSSITATPAKCSVDGDSKIKPQPCPAKFDALDDGTYKVAVELKGDVPSGFKLTSDALVEGGSGGSGGEGAADESKPGSNKTALIVGVVGGIVALILIAGGVGGFFAYRFYKKKALEKQTGKGQAKTAKRAGNKPPSSTVTDDAKSTEPASKSVDRKKTKDGNEKGAPEARKAMSKDGSAKKPGGGNAKTLTEGSEKKPEKVWWIS